MAGCSKYLVGWCFWFNLRWSCNNIKSVNIEKRHITLTYPELSGICKGSSVRLPHFYFENIPENRSKVENIGSIVK